MSFEDTILNYWEFFVLAPVGYVSAKVFSINSKVNVNAAKIEILEKAVDSLCKKHDTTNDLLREIKGKLSVNES